MAACSAVVVGRDPPPILRCFVPRRVALPYARLSTAQPLRVGQLVVAVGNPFGFESQCLPAWSVHWGARFAVAMADSSKVWFSTRLRSIPATRVVRWWTHVTGCRRQYGDHCDGARDRLRRSGGTAQWVLTEILTQGRVRRAYLGVTVRDRTLDLRLVRALDLQVTRAVEIMTRDDQGPAATADLRSGDLIVAVNDVAVDGIDALHLQLSRCPVGTAITLQVIRRMQSLKIALTPRETD